MKKDVSSNKSTACLALADGTLLFGKGFGSTGSADFQKIWTYLGLPAISLPLLTGENDLPLGLQLVGNKYDDLRFLGTAKWLEDNCKDE